MTEDSTECESRNRELILFAMSPILETQTTENYVTSYLILLTYKKLYHMALKNNVITQLKIKLLTLKTLEITHINANSYSYLC